MKLRIISQHLRLRVVQFKNINTKCVFLNNRSKIFYGTIDIELNDLCPVDYYITIPYATESTTEFRLKRNILTNLRNYFH